MHKHMFTCCIYVVGRKTNNTDSIHWRSGYEFAWSTRVKFIFYFSCFLKKVQQNLSRPVDSERMIYQGFSELFVNREIFIFHIRLYLSIFHASLRVLDGQTLLAKHLKPSSTWYFSSSRSIYCPADPLHQPLPGRAGGCSFEVRGRPWVEVLRFFSFRIQRLANITSCQSYVL